MSRRGHILAVEAWSEMWDYFCLFCLFELQKKYLQFELQIKKYWLALICACSWFSVCVARVNTFKLCSNDRMFQADLLHAAHSEYATSTRTLTLGQLRRAEKLNLKFQTSIH